MSEERKEGSAQFNIEKRDEKMKVTFVILEGYGKYRTVGFSVGYPKHNCIPNPSYFYGFGKKHFWYKETLSHYWDLTEQNFANILLTHLGHCFLELTVVNSEQRKLETIFVWV